MESVVQYYVVVVAVRTVVETVFVVKVGHRIGSLQSGTIPTLGSAQPIRQPGMSTFSITTQEMNIAHISEVRSYYPKFVVEFRTPDHFSRMCPSVGSGNSRPDPT